MFFKYLLISLTVFSTLGKYCGNSYYCNDKEFPVCCGAYCCKDGYKCEDGECKPGSAAAIIASIVSSIVVIGLLIYCGYRWHAMKQKKKAAKEAEERKKAYQPAPTVQIQLPTMTQDGENNQLIMPPIVLSPDQLKQIQNQLSGAGQQAQAK